MRREARVAAKARKSTPAPGPIRRAVVRVDARISADLPRAVAETLYLDVCHLARQCGLELHDFSTATGKVKAAAKPARPRAGKSTGKPRQPRRS